MNFTLKRLYHTTKLTTGNYTCGFLTNDVQSFRSFCLEDGVSPTGQKIAGQTRIPAGKYELKLQKTDTPLTIKHRKDYANTGWFKANPNWYHIEVTGIPNYAGVYVHSGNDDAHTLGCLLPNYAFDLSVTDNQGSKSLLAVSDFYAICYPLLEKGEKVFIDVKDE